MTSTAIRPRVSRGVPSGGQFAANSRSESAVSLDILGFSSRATDANEYQERNLLDLAAALPARPEDPADERSVQRAASLLRTRAQTATDALERRLGTAKIVTAAYQGLADPSRIAFVRIESRYNTEGVKQPRLVPLDENYQPLPAQVAFDGNTADLADDFVVEDRGVRTAVRLARTVVDARAVVTRDWRADIALTQAQATADAERAAALDALLDD